MYDQAARYITLEQFMKSTQHTKKCKDNTPDIFKWPLYHKTTTTKPLRVSRPNTESQKSAQEHMQSPQMK